MCENQTSEILKSQGPPLFELFVVICTNKCMGYIYLMYFKNINQSQKGKERERKKKLGMRQKEQKLLLCKV